MVLTRYLDRRQFIRIPVSGILRWCSEQRSGVCEVVDISPTGAGLRMPLRQAYRLGNEVSLEVELPGGKTWQLATHAKVRRNVPAQDGMARVGVSFPPAEWRD